MLILLFVVERMYRADVPLWVREVSGAAGEPRFIPSWEEDENLGLMARWSLPIEFVRID